MLLEEVPYVTLYVYNQKYPSEKINAYEENAATKMWTPCGSTCCIYLA